MTREEAWQGLEGYALFIADGTELKEAISMAIEALKADVVPIEKYHELQHQFVMLGASFADRVEVVRCKDCKYKYIKAMNAYCPFRTGALKVNGYCDYGEREE